MGTVLFGYRPIRRPDDMPACPCGDNHVSFEQPGADPLDCRVNCWCGRHVRVTFDSIEERAQFIDEALGQPDHHTFAYAMTTGDSQRRFVCSCGESGLAVPDEGAARADHERHARSRELAQKGADT